MLLPAPAGVCGKKADTANLQDELTGALIGLARAVDNTMPIPQSTWHTMIEGLFTTVTNVSFDNAAIETMIQKVRSEKERLVQTADQAEKGRRHCHSLYCKPGQHSDGQPQLL